MRSYVMKYTLVAALTLFPGLVQAQQPTSNNCQAKCIEALKAADAYQAELRKEIDIYKGLTVTQDDQIANLHKQLKGAEIWYRQPEFTIPATALLTILLLFPQKQPIVLV